ncbi:hypothetical protein L5515_005488 [Caenorhabditis briggsae]|uniref:Uncharacterized protein n=1 Tax=Caenorhabditis briggsae TaxID=6238 RepID=A0AAE9DFE8_CAEBR|nr:hypothetical protein L3Y34_002642 [Caenorhabditis briggsae]UMM25831.1 hypothetical protein L5515_005488 [Caenorhabditis briggsae]
MSKNEEKETKRGKNGKKNGKKEEKSGKMSKENEEKMGEIEENLEKILEKIEIEEKKTPEQLEAARIVKEAKLAAKKAEEYKKLDEQIEEHVKIFQDPNVDFHGKMQQLIDIPANIKHALLDKKRSERLFSSIPLEMFETAFDPANERYATSRPVLIHVISFIVQCTAPEVHKKFKPVMANIVASVAPRDNKAEMNTVVYNDMTTIVCTWADERGDGKCIYDLLRHLTTHFNAQKMNLEVGQFLLCVRMLIQKVYMIAPIERPESFDNRMWTIGILSIVRRLLQERPEKFTKDLRQLLWDVISSMTRVAGIGWFNIDKSFAKLVIQLNHTEMQLALIDAHNPDILQFNRNLRILEMYTTAICEGDLYGDSEQSIIPHTVGESTRYLLNFWTECFLQKIELPTQLALSIFHFAVYIFVHEELKITDDKVRKNFGNCALSTAFTILEQATEADLKGEIGQLFSDMLERLAEFENLNDQVPIFLMRFLDKIRMADDYETWKGKVIDVECCLMDLRGRIDWYSKKTLKEADGYLRRFTEPEKHELNHHVFKIFNELPRVN